MNFLKNILITALNSKEVRTRLYKRSTQIVRFFNKNLT
jgi:hypothetical protein